MGRINDALMNNPDKFLTVVGFGGGFVFGTANLDLWGGVAAGLLMALFTIAIANVEPHDPALGPHQ